MRIRVVSAALVGAFSMTAIATLGWWSKEPVPQSIAEATQWAPAAVLEPRLADSVMTVPKTTQVGGARKILNVTLLQPDVTETALPVIEPPLVTWTRQIASGETLDAVLANAGIAAPARAEIALALGVEYDLRRLRPGHEITVISNADGSPKRVELAIDDGVRIETVFGEELLTRVLEPDPEVVIFASEAVVESSISAALDKAKIPARFAVDLAQMLGGTINFQRELSGGERMRLLWREAREGNKRIGQPELAFAALDLAGSVYEIVWPDDGSGQATIYVDGEVLRVFAQPVEGARLSSVFGRRTHPVYGNVRMHTGVDFAAARGTPVKATAPGRVSFIGRRGGYGRVVEISHGSDTLTRYAHLSEVPDTLEHGQSVMAGDMIGRVGATGTATGPNLHYEVLVDGRPTDPLSDDRLAEAADRDAVGTAALERLAEARSLLAERLTSEFVQTTTERL